MEIILLLLGLLILGITFFDFFHTTLSGQGFGRLSGKINELLGQWILKHKNSYTFKYSGFLHLLVTTLFWLLMLILGTFIIYSSAPEMVITSETKIPATLLEKFYYTCFVISTLGIGDFVPGNNLSRILTSFLSFSGFILLTTALTYLLSVVNTVLQKKQLAFYISTLGNDIEELYKTITTPQQGNLLLENTSSIRQMIIKNSSNYIFFPIVQYYLSNEKKAALELQLTRLFEVLEVMSYQMEPDNEKLIKIKTILATISNYLYLGIEDKKDYSYNPDDLERKRKFWFKYNIEYKEDRERDSAINAALKSSGWTWADVYSLEKEDASSF